MQAEIIDNSGEYATFCPEFSNRTILNKNHITHRIVHNVVLDANIVISAAISKDGNPAEIFELFLSSKIKNYTTKEILGEIEVVLNRPLLKKYLNEEYKKFIFENFKELSFIIEPSFDENAVLEDKKDNKFINCALSANADIISGDNHLLKLGNYKGIKIFSAKNFLEKLNKE